MSAGRKTDFENKGFATRTALKTMACKSNNIKASSTFMVPEKFMKPARKSYAMPKVVDTTGCGGLRNAGSHKSRDTIKNIKILIKYPERKILISIIPVFLFFCFSLIAE
jgi:hypothetical protein